MVSVNEEPVHAIGILNFFSLFCYQSTLTEGRKESITHFHSFAVTYWTMDMRVHLNIQVQVEPVIVH